MNHFLLPGDISGDSGELRYGINAMEKLINALLREGAQRERLQAKVFGGSNLLSKQRQIGTANAKFALWFLNNEGIRCISQDVGGNQGRKLRFWPHSGRVQRLLLEASKSQDYNTRN